MIKIVEHNDLWFAFTDGKIGKGKTITEAVGDLIVSNNEEFKIALEFDTTNVVP
jgi:hypothetical protein